MALLNSRQLVSWGGLDMSRELASFKLGEERQKLTYRTLDTRAVRNETGPLEVKASASGHFVDGMARTNALRARMKTGEAHSLIFQVEDGINVSAPSAPTCLLVPSVCLSGQMVEGEANDLLKLSGEFYGKGVDVYDGQMLYSSKKDNALTATGVTAAILTGATAASETRVYAAHVLDLPISAGTAITIEFESDADAGFASPVVRATVGPFAAGAPAGGSVSVAGANADTHHRLKVTITGTTPSFPVVAGTGVAPT